MLKKLSTQNEGMNSLISVKTLHEKFKVQGKSAMSNEELLQILFSFRGNRKKMFRQSAEIIKYTEGRLDLLAKMSIQDLNHMKSLNSEDAILLSVIWELGNRKNAAYEQGQLICSSKDARRVFISELSDLPHEEFYAAFLNRRHRLLGKHQISKGGISATVVDIRLLLEKAIQFHASGIIIAHNHPSGNTTASVEDRELTSKIQKACCYFDINLLDHLIYCGHDIISFSDEGWI